MKNRLIWAILGLLGFSACDNENTVEMYGVPTVDFAVDGKVADSNGNPIEGIQVTCEEDGYESVSTGEDGRFFFQRTGFGQGVPFTKNLQFRDVDGSENGEFANEELSLTFTEEDRTEKDKGSWYNGAFEKDGVEVSLDEKSE